MLLQNFFFRQDDVIRISRQQGSDFAKNIAGDFNPIHDTDNKRFCVPGDLLFALVLNNYGVSQQMQFTFSGMVGDDIPLNFPASDESHLDIQDSNGKTYLSIDRKGDVSENQTLIDNLTASYVAFSGQTFPHILVPLMREHGVMINPERPLVMYDSMSIDMASLAAVNPLLELSESRLQVDGKRGNVCLRFSLIDNNEIVGTGEKRMLLSGLREFDQSSINKLIAHYNGRKQSYRQPAEAQLA